jgi:CheY-like chemotaxis protein
MEDEKRILVVDDHFRILDSIKSLLEASGKDYEVIGVPSAEEGILEIRRKPVELLITDVYLPGMSGGELIVRANKLWPDLPIIVITGHAEKMGREEAAKSGIFHYFRKPLETDAFLDAVHSVMEGVDRKEYEKPTDKASTDTASRTQSVISIMERLLEATQASEVLLSSIDGDRVYRSGERESSLLDISETFTQAVSGILQLSGRMGSTNPLTYHYIADRSFELYFATAGSSFYVAVFYSYLSRQKSIETIWTSLQQAIDQYQQVIRDESQSDPSEVMIVQLESEKEDDLHENAPVSEEEVGLVELNSDNTPVFSDLDYPDLPKIDETVDLDAFWDEAVAVELGGGETAVGLNIDEARKMGALPPEFDPDEHP